MKRPMMTRAAQEALAFWLNVYNLLCLHGHIKFASQYARAKEKERLEAYRELKYRIAGEELSLADIEQGILRAPLLERAGHKPYFKPKDPRAQLALRLPEPKVCTCICTARDLRIVCVCVC